MVRQGEYVEIKLDTPTDAEGNALNWLQVYFTDVDDFAGSGLFSPLNGAQSQYCSNIIQPNGSGASTDDCQDHRATTTLGMLWTDDGKIQVFYDGVASNKTWDLEALGVDSASLQWNLHIGYRIPNQFYAGHSAPSSAQEIKIDYIDHYKVR